jgi:hypothetical protein
MSVSPVELANTTQPVNEEVEAEVKAEAASTQVLITTEQVLFDTAAAGIHRDKTRGGFRGIVRRFFATSTDASRSPQHDTAHDAPRRYAFLESALMAREMDRL